MKTKTKEAKFSEKEVPFEIEHIDSLGQGVSKKNDQILFIPKTLPKETGKALILSSKKKVFFGKMKELQETSPDRQTPECPHFEDCGGCHYLHTSYEKEIELKKQSALFSLRKLAPEQEIQIIKAPERLGYRNRVQLHYDKAQRLLGMMKSFEHSIVNTPECKLPDPKIQKAIKDLSESQRWPRPHKGHVELALKDNQVQLNWNLPYSADGFTQVNNQMNQIFLQDLKELIPHDRPTIDLFGGKGNLSQNFSEKTWVIDSSDYEQRDMKAHQSYLKLNLYEEKALQKLSVSLAQFRPEVMLIDPPRSGLKELPNFVDYFDPEYIGYLSCFYPTMIRDLISLKGPYEVSSIRLYDFFPGTKHIEAFCLLKKSR